MNRNKYSNIININISSHVIDVKIGLYKRNTIKLISYQSKYVPFLELFVWIIQVQSILHQTKDLSFPDKWFNDFSKNGSFSERHLPKGWSSLWSCWVMIYNIGSAGKTWLHGLLIRILDRLLRFHVYKLETPVWSAS